MSKKPKTKPHTLTQPSHPPKHCYVQYSKTWKIPGYPEFFSLNKKMNKLSLASQVLSRADHVLLWALCICWRQLKKKTSSLQLGFSSALPGVICSVIHEELSPSRVVGCRGLECSWVQKHGWLIQSSLCWHNRSRSRKGVGRGWKAYREKID